MCTVPPDESKVTATTLTTTVSTLGASLSKAAVGLAGLAKLTVHWKQHQYCGLTKISISYPFCHEIKKAVCEGFVLDFSGNHPSFLLCFCRTQNGLHHQLPAPGRCHSGHLAQDQPVHSSRFSQCWIVPLNREKHHPGCPQLGHTRHLPRQLPLLQRSPVQLLALHWVFWQAWFVCL